MKCFAIFIVALIAGASAVPCPPKAENTNTGGFLNLGFLGSAVGTVGQAAQTTLNTGVTALNKINVGGLIEDLGVENFLDDASAIAVAAGSAVVIAVASLVVVIATIVAAIFTVIAQIALYIAQYAAYFSTTLQQIVAYAAQLTGYIEQITACAANTVTTTTNQALTQFQGTVQTVCQQLQTNFAQITNEVTQIGSPLSQSLFGSFSAVQKTLITVVDHSQQTIESVNVSQYLQIFGGLAYQVDGFFYQAQAVANQISQKVVTLGQQAAQAAAQTLISLAIGVAQVVQFVATSIATAASYVAVLAKNIAVGANITYSQSITGFNQIFKYYNIPVPKCGY